jgi:hypothetical protein
MSMSVQELVRGEFEWADAQCARQQVESQGDRRVGLIQELRAPEQWLAFTEALDLGIDEINRVAAGSNVRRVFDGGTDSRNYIAEREQSPNLRMVAGYNPERCVIRYNFELVGIGRYPTYELRIQVDAVTCEVYLSTNGTRASIEPKDLAAKLLGRLSRGDLRECAFR